MRRVPTAEERSCNRVEGIVLARVRGKESLTWAYNSLVENHGPDEIRKVFRKNWEHFSKLNEASFLELASELGLN